MAHILTNADFTPSKVLPTLDKLIENSATSSRHEILEVMNQEDPLGEDVLIIGQNYILILDAEGEHHLYRLQPKTKMPSLKELVSNAASAAARTAKRAVTGQKVVAPEEVRQERMLICQACPHYENGVCKTIHLPDGTIERGCGCRLSAKTALAGESCPQGKWLPVEG